MSTGKPFLQRIKKVIFTPAIGVLLVLVFFTIFNCRRSTKPVPTNREIILGFIRSSPELFSNSILDTTGLSLAGSSISFGRNFRVGTPHDTIVVINSLDTVGNVIQSRSVVEAGVDLLDTLIGTLRSSDSAGTHTRNFRLLVSKFGYFQNLGNLAPQNRGWAIRNVGQTYMGAANLLERVRLRAISSNKDTVFVRRPRSSDPETDPQLVPVLFNPFQLKFGDSVEIQAYVNMFNPDTNFFVICHITDLNSTRRVQLFSDSSGRFFGGFKFSSESGLDHRYRRLAIDVITRSALTNPFATFQNEIWGIVYQLVP